MNTTQVYLTAISGIVGFSYVATPTFAIQGTSAVPLAESESWTEQQEILDPKISIGGTSDAPPSDPRPSTSLPTESCQRWDDSILPMINLRPIGNEYNWTRSETPTLLFYVPYRVNTGEFVVYRNNSAEELYRMTFTVPDAAGIVSLEISSPLPPNEYHEWVFQVNCEGGDIKETVGGLIARQGVDAADPQDPNHLPFYDVLAATATQHGTDGPEWSDLLQAIDALDDAHSDWDIDFVDLADYSQIPILGPVSPYTVP